VNVNGGSGYAGYCSDNRTVCELLRLGDAWVYEPYERFEVELPDGTITGFGRLLALVSRGMMNFRCFSK